MDHKNQLDASANDRSHSPRFYCTILHRVQYRYGKSSVCDVQVSLSHRL